MKKLNEKLVRFCMLLAINTNTIGFANNCDNIHGTWNGRGVVKWFFFTCEYNAVAKIGAGNPASAQVSISKSAGRFICPSKAEETVVVSCNNNRIEMKDSRVDVAGNLSDDGTSVKLEGYVNVMYKNHPFTLTANKVS